jgi:hypothetical protein
MSEDRPKLEPGRDVEFEREDLKPKGVYIFLGGLGVITGVVALLLGGLARYMDRYDKAHQAAQSPLVTAAMPDAESRRSVPVMQTEQEIKIVFPLPRLEENERTEVIDFRTEEEERLNSYGFVDEKAGMVHIPIERAMELTVQRLPARPESGTAQPRR